MGDDREIVADHQQGQPVVAAQAAEQVEDFRLHRDVQGAGRLVEQQDARFQDQGAGDGHALALAAGKLVGVAVAVLAAEADFGKHLGDARLAAVQPVDGDRQGEDLVHRLVRVQRAVRILEDHLRHLALRRGAASVHPAAGQRDLAGRIRDQSGDGAQHGGFAGAGFAHQADRLAFGDGKRQVADGHHGARAAAVGDGDAVERDHARSAIQAGSRCNCGSSARRWPSWGSAASRPRV